MTTTTTDDKIKTSIATIRTYNDFLKEDTDIELINVKDDKDKMYGTITRISNKSIQYNDYDKVELSYLIYDEFEKNLMITEKLPEEIDSERFKYLEQDDRVLVYEDKITTRGETTYSMEEESYKQYKGNFIEPATRSGNEHYRKHKHTSDKHEYIPILYKGMVVSKGTNHVYIIRDDDKKYTAIKYNFDGTIEDTTNVFNLRIIDKTKDIESIKLLIYDNKRKIKIAIEIHKIERDPKNKENILLHIEGKIYKVKQSSDATAQILKIDQKIKQSKAKMELGELKYKLRWNYKTNYSGSKYFPLKVSNIKLLSESEKYSQIDKYIELKEGDIVKYNDSSHKNYGLLAKVVSIGEDTRDARKYYETRKLYTITFEPFESYVPTAELKQYKRKYQNMEKSIANVSASKLLKFRFVEVFYYEKDVFDTVKDTGKEGEGTDKKKGAATDETQSKLDKLNDVIFKKTLDTLKKNSRFIPDYVLGKHQPESKTDLNKLIKPNNKNAYIISLTPSIKKRPNGLYFDYTETTERGVIGYEINIYVDLTLLQSKVITQEEWDNKSLTEKIGNIFLDKIKNSEVGVFNCPNRWDKLKNIMGNMKQGIWFSDIETSEPNLIKQLFKKNSEKISRLKDELTEQEDAKKKLEQKIKEAQKSKELQGNDEELKKKQKELQAIDEKIKETQRKIIQLEALTSYKGGMKSRYTKKARKTRKKTKPLNKYIKVRTRKTRKCLKLLL
jgi:hypothetical protein